MPDKLNQIHRHFQTKYPKSIVQVEIQDLPNNTWEGTVTVDGDCIKKSVNKKRNIVLDQLSEGIA